MTGFRLAPWRKIGRFGALLGGVLFFMITAAPGGGGGGGGGAGGSALYGGSPHDGAGFAPFVGVAALLVLAGVAGALILRMTEIALVLPAGKYLPVLDEVMRTAKFGDPASRAWVLTRLSERIAPEDVLSGFVRIRWTAPQTDLFLNRAQAAYQKRIQMAGLREEPAAEVAAARRQAPAAEDDVCVLGVLCSIDLWTKSRDGDMREASQLLGRLGHRPRGPHCLYLYYSPDPGQSLSAGAGKRLLSLLEASGGKER